MSLLFIDTESNPITKEPFSTQIRFKGESFLFRDFNKKTFHQIKQMWNTAGGIVMYNAPYDMGVLSICFDNTYKWVEEPAEEGNASSWEMRLFDNKYHLRKLSFHRNFIRSYNRMYDMSNKQMVSNGRSKKSGHNKLVHKFNKSIPKTPSTPIIDLLKLWSILIDDGSGKDKGIGLKKVVLREFGYAMLEYSEQNSHLDKYALDDVIYLEKLWFRFIEKIKSINETNTFSYKDWSDIKTPATFTKIIYDDVYKMKEIKKLNDIIIADLDIITPLQSSYNGGLTMSMYRGKISDVAWVDITGAYAKAIEVLNTDQYLKFNLEKTKNFNFIEPFLMRVKSNFIMKSINKSLKLFYVKDNTENWIWNFDILALQNLVSDYRYEVIECYSIIPLMPSDIVSLPVDWQNKKNMLDKHNESERVLREFYKYLGNTSYGIKAQHKPWQTNHTNFVIAGMITSKVHQILTTIIRVGESNSLLNLYNDTDSAAFHFHDKFDISIIDKINASIYPFNVELEGIFKDNNFLSLKRYTSTNDMSKEYGLKPQDDKIKLHGKGRYKINQAETLEYIETKTIENEGEVLVYPQMSANTERGMKMILNIDGYSEVITHPHPFMFVTDIQTDRLKLDYFDKWFWHIDTKLTFSRIKENFFRTFHKFKDTDNAVEYFSNKLDSAEDRNMDFRDWDKELKEDFIL